MNRQKQKFDQSLFYNFMTDKSKPMNVMGFFYRMDCYIERRLIYKSELKNISNHGAVDKPLRS